MKKIEFRVEDQFLVEPSAPFGAPAPVKVYYDTDGKPQLIAFKYDYDEEHPYDDLVAVDPDEEFYFTEEEARQRIASLQQELREMLPEVRKRVLQLFNIYVENEKQLDGKPLHLQDFLGRRLASVAEKGLRPQTV